MAESHTPLLVSGIGLRLARGRDASAIYPALAIVPSGRGIIFRWTRYLAYALAERP